MDFPNFSGHCHIDKTVGMHACCASTKTKRIPYNHAITHHHAPIVTTARLCAATQPDIISFSAPPPRSFPVSPSELIPRSHQEHRALSRSLPSKHKVMFPALTSFARATETAKRGRHHKLPRSGFRRGFGKCLCKVSCSSLVNLQHHASQAFFVHGFPLAATK